MGCAGEHGQTRSATANQPIRRGTHTRTCGDSKSGGLFGWPNGPATESGRAVALVAVCAKFGGVTS